MEIDAAKSFGDVLKELRKRKKLSRRELGQRISMHPKSIEKWERGDILPDRARVSELICAIGLSEREELLLLEAHAGFRILPSLHNLPAQRNPYFTARAETLAQLHQQLAPGSHRTPQAIIGLGGIGKTQVALEYVYRYQKQYSHLLWVTANSREILIAEFSKLARDLDLPEKDEKDQNKVVQAMQSWLREYLGWLLILDNIEDLGLVSEFVPTGHLGSVLLTNRRQVTEPVAQGLELKAFSVEEGVSFLLKRAKRLAADEAIDQAAIAEAGTARTITQQLGGLPLALDQAGAYMAETGCSLADYLDLLEQRQAALLQRRGTVLSDHPQSVTTTFSLAFDRVQQQNEAAIELLKLCVYLASDAIPLEVITEGAGHLGTVLEPAIIDPLQFDQALETLQTYSLVRRDGENRTLSIHRLVQAVLQDTQEEVEKRIWAERALLAVNAAFPHVEYSTWARCERLLPQALALALVIEQYQLLSEEAGRLLYETASYLQNRARYAEAEPLYQYALHIREQQLGPEHTDVGYSLKGLAALYHEQGKYAEAEPLYQRALRIWEKHFGPEHPEVSRPLDSLATLFYEWGKFDEAKAFYLRALQIKEHHFGPEHPNVAYPLTSLAALYGKLGRFTEAEVLYLRGLQIREQHLGPEHPGIAQTTHEFALLLEAQGNCREAKNWYTRTLTLREQALGAQHPKTIETRTRLIALLHAIGQHEEAAQLEIDQAAHEQNRKEYPEE